MTQFILHLIESAGYWGVALLMALENVFPPIPSEVIMGFGGIIVAHGRMTFGWLLAFGTAGSVAGNYAWYLVGRLLGLERLKPLVDRWGRWLTIEWRDLEKLNTFFDAHGGKTVLIARILPTFRTMISLPAGLTRMPTAKFLAMTAIGTGIWNTICAAFGYWLGMRFTAIEKFTGPAAAALFAGVIVLYLYRVLTWKPRG
ncbi:DedA family protein [Hephaestia mangrovi]|uniref:DedA family protein n=1 Tax=Hephaestia mangrovi TaxID=2873268 RepID=UPI001CA7A1EF|nr:DedA family protein [Hephaestia mangrovi]MBY8828645.1 DedA family protein [Hephaestia mangrovi]